MDYCSFNKHKHGYDNVLIIVDRLTKQAIFIPCHKEVDSCEQARLYLYHVYRYYNALRTIVSNRGLQFISDFWQEFNRLLNTDIKLSTVYHFQTDSQTEIYNQYLQQQLQPFYPASDLKTAPHKLHDFHRSNPTQPGPPAQLLEWIKLYKSGEDDYDYADNNKPMSAADRKLFFETTL
ncbi:hypothetical protein DSL72_000321 [Monilinia vaccinii-corymbosi]|uniref:Integrase catalytic domain-containing protein n=1 Tax=Monilinia vaccinii-corymbosi TaxID=61207 RepID=A0A8A3NYZ7_9HELO|nr:hypothetical protein DSL72_000321 [Monilinia vaccinii-corymbosi]